MFDLICISSVLKGIGDTLQSGALAWKRVCYICEFKGLWVNPLALPDEAIMLLINKPVVNVWRVYCATSTEEEEICKSLCNLGVMRQVSGGYKLTWANRYLAKNT